MGGVPVRRDTSTPCEGSQWGGGGDNTEPTEQLRVGWNPEGRGFLEGGAGTALTFPPPAAPLVAIRPRCLWPRSASCPPWRFARCSARPRIHRNPKTPETRRRPRRSRNISPLCAITSTWSRGSGERRAGPFARSRPPVCTPAQPCAPASCRAPLGTPACSPLRVPALPVHACAPPPPICTPTTCRLQQNRVLPFAHPQAPPRLCAAVCTAVSSHLHTHPLPQLPSRLHGPICTAACPPLTLLRSPLPTHEPHLHTHRPHLHTRPAPMSTSCLPPPTLPLFAHPCSPLHVPTATGSAAAPCLQCWCSLWVPAAMRRGEHHLPPTPDPPDPPGCVPTRNPCCPHRSDIDDDSAW